MSSVACPDCQYEISELALDCPQCGQPQPDLAPAGSPEKTGSCGYCGEAVTALGLATAALIIWPLAIAAVVYGFSALGAFREREGRNQPAEKGRWMAVTAVVVALVAVPLVAWGIVFV